MSISIKFTYNNFWDKLHGRDKDIIAKYEKDKVIEFDLSTDYLSENMASLIKLYVEVQGEVCKNSLSIKMWNRLFGIPESIEDVKLFSGFEFGFYNSIFTRPYIKKDGKRLCRELRDIVETCHLVSPIK